MISILRTITTSLIPTRISVTKFMDSSSSSSNAIIGGSERLLALAHHLRLYKPPPPFAEDILEQSIEENGGKVVSQLGFPESATTIQNPEKFSPKKAAVLICLFEGDAGDLRVILTKRSSKLSTHSGEVSLPGGKADEGDKDDGDTAKREAKEEIGLDPELVNVVTVLEPFLSKHLLRVVPVIGILHDKKAFKPVLNPAEVESVFDAPLEMFLKDEKRTQEEREWMGEKYLIHFFDYDDIENKKYLIWGLTAGILIRAASIVYKRPPAFIEQNPKFKVPQVVSKGSSMT
ncbi:nudix hydrolase 15, mitochondrial-like [Trifolium pratense]|uniref:nudix hydrolase 15, mitochondrial-like n=1 Tax=Trifolium pratense TaxID=57577 RepID=UPI001E68FE9F|nr:nudix hydrolase 15, mitochondrial-like [Trifolium pratense]